MSQVQIYNCYTEGWSEKREDYTWTHELNYAGSYEVFFCFYIFIYESDKETVLCLMVVVDSKQSLDLI